MIALLLAASVAAGSYTYKTTYNGVDLGTSKVTVANAPGSTQISEQTAGSYIGTSGSATATLVLNADLSPASYRASGTMGGNPISDSATVSGTTMAVTSARGTTASFHLVDGAKHFIVVDLGTVAGFVPLAAQIKTWNDSNVLAVVPSFGQSLSINVVADSDARPAGVPAADVALSFSGHAPFTLWYDPATLVPDRIEVPSQNVVITRTQ